MQSIAIAIAVVTSIGITSFRCSRHRLHRRHGLKRTKQEGPASTETGQKMAEKYVFTLSRN